MTRRRILIEFTDEEMAMNDSEERFDSIGEDLRRMEEGVEQPIRLRENGEEVCLDSLQRYSGADAELFDCFSVLVPRLYDYLVFDGEIPEWKREDYREEMELIVEAGVAERVSELLAPEVRRELFPATMAED